MFTSPPGRAIVIALGSRAINALACFLRIAVQLGDAAGAGNEGDPLQGVLSGLGEVAGDLHGGRLGE